MRGSWRPRGRVLIILLLAIFAMSGATSLVYETIWARQLHLVFGTSQLAICTLLAAFMAGLAAGGFVGGVWARRTTRPLLAYAIVEAVIGAYALVFPVIVRALEPLYLGTRETLQPSPLIFGLIQFLLLAAVLLPPTVGMGATLPLLVRVLASDARAAGRVVGRLYGANTIGAVLGTALAGFVLLPRLGLSSSTSLAAATNGGLALIAAGLALIADRSRIIDASSATRRPDIEPDPISRGLVRTLLLVAALAGFTSLLYEVAWFRVLVLLLGGSAYAFTIMLLAFLLGIGIGGWLGGGLADRFARRGGAAALLRGLAWMQVSIGLLAWGAMFAYGELPTIWVWMYDRVEHAAHLMWPLGLLLALGIMLPPTLLMGAAFPFLVRAAARATDTVAAPTGWIYGTNTLGAVAGAFAGGFFLLPGLHVRGTVLAAASLNVLAALLAAAGAAGLAPARNTRSILRWTAAAAALLALIQLVRPPWQPLLMTAGMYKYVQLLPERSREALLAYAVHRHDLLFYDEGLSSVVTVARHRSTGGLWLANNGKVDATSEGDRRTQTMLAHLPFLFRPDSEQVLVIGLASGMTAGSVTMHRAPTRIDVVEIEPAVVRASHVFDEVNHRPLEDPRTSLHLNDARNHLLLMPDACYDLISSEPSNPWLTGVANLFTSEFFALGKRKLRPGGIWAQWLQTYCMDVDDLRCLLVTFADHFEHVRVFRIDSADLVILGSDDPLSLDVAALNVPISSQPAVAEDLAACGLNHVEDVLALYQVDRAVIERLGADVVRNTDDNMRIEHAAPLHLFEWTRDENTRLLRDVAEVPAAAGDDAAALVRLGEAYLREGDLRRAAMVLERVRSLLPDDPAAAALAREVEDRAASKASP
ncbi:MAG: fused MFS/spermidine synthase [Planctomycetota bacterium]|jgi:spermidine synthase